MVNFQLNFIPGLIAWKIITIYHETSSTLSKFKMIPKYINIKLYSKQKIY